MKEHTFRKLLVWQKSIDLVTRIYNDVKVFPSDELYALTSQIKRSATSIPSNIAEGYGRDGKKRLFKIFKYFFKFFVRVANTT